MERSFGLDANQLTMCGAWQAQLPRSRAVDGAQFIYEFTHNKQRAEVRVRCGITNKELQLGAWDRTVPPMFTLADITKSQEAAVDALLAEFEKATVKYTFIPSSLVVTTKFSVDFTDYDSI